MSSASCGMVPFDVATTKAAWPVLPKAMSVIEFGGDGDPFFGGKSDDRPLGRAGSLLSAPYCIGDVAVFATIEDAYDAALNIINRRPGGLLGVAPVW